MPIFDFIQIRYLFLKDVPHSATWETLTLAIQLQNVRPCFQLGERFSGWLKTTSDNKWVKVRMGKHNLRNTPGQCPRTSFVSRVYQWPFRCNDCLYETLCRRWKNIQQSQNKENRLAVQGNVNQAEHWAEFVYVLQQEKMSLSTLYMWATIQILGNPQWQKTKY